LWVKATPESQRELRAADPRRFFVPPYLGPRGWVGVWLDGDVDWAEVGELVTDGYRLAAPKRLARLLDQP
jgi:predicted DNA-binding protein (MmcQ/YjbR family)